MISEQKRTACNENREIPGERKLFEQYCTETVGHEKRWNRRFAKQDQVFARGKREICGTGTHCWRCQKRKGSVYRWTQEDHGAVRGRNKKIKTRKKLVCKLKSGKIKFGIKKSQTSKLQNF